MTIEVCFLALTFCIKIRVTNFLDANLPKQPITFQYDRLHAIIYFLNCYMDPITLSNFWYF